MKSIQKTVFKVESIGEPALKYLLNKPNLSIHSVFQKVVNLKTDSELLITIGNNELKNLPYGLLCNYKELDLRNRIRTDQKVQVDIKGFILISEGPYEIDFSHALVWSPIYQKIIKTSKLYKINKRLERLKKYSQDNASGRGLTSLSFVIDELISNQPIECSNILEIKALKGIRTVIEGIRRYDHTRSVFGGLDLMGLGPGLTPSGDDLLVSLLLSVIVTNPEPIRSFALGVARELAKISMDRTTCVSINQYLNAGEGYVSERFMDVIDSIINLDDEMKLLQRAKCMISFGETSGLEILIGLLVGISLSLEFHQKNVLNHNE
ncbi:MAG: DUF2877 domain-containing protein [Pelolinea sp.]|nr:DUF2877 domain-containing protein [Pelolinea sp.]